MRHCYNTCMVFMLLCRFDAESPVLMCQKNAAIAAAVNRTDLVQVNLITWLAPVHYVAVINCRLYTCLVSYVHRSAVFFIHFTILST